MAHLDPPCEPSGPSLRDMWLSEMWRPCPEVSREERAVQRARNAACVRPVDNGAHSVDHLS